MTTYVTADELVAKCLTSGLVIRKAPTFAITHPPLTLRPLSISQRTYTDITTLQTDWNVLVDTIARDFSFLSKSLERCAASDAAFTGRLLSMMQQVYVKPDPTPTVSGSASPPPIPPCFQRAMLGVFRTDYMEDGRTKQWKNVEINTISVSFAGLAPRVNAFHQYLLAAEKMECPTVRQPLLERGTSDLEVPRALAETHEYVLNNGFVEVPGDAAATPTLVPVVVFVIQENERNTGDQYLLSIRLLEAHGVRSVRRTLSQLGETIKLVPSACAEKPPCAVFDNFIATVFYFRCGYVPADFISERCWEAREAIERSSAVKCPSLPHHLVGFKKIQQLLCDGAILRRFTTSEESAVRLSSTFMGQHSLDVFDETALKSIAERDATQSPSAALASSIDALIADAVANPRKYVLKPQLEGGGNLVSGNGIVDIFRLPPEDPTFQRVRTEYILMERIPFDATPGSILREGAVLSVPGGLCSELGVFGTVLSTGSSDGSTMFNRSVGTLVRTKPADVDDGGVMAGVAALDSLCIEPLP